MPVSDDSQKRQLECLRLVAELAQLATETSDPDLKAQFLRTAAMWSNQADQDEIDAGELPTRSGLSE